MLHISDLRLRTLLRLIWYNGVMEELNKTLQELHDDMLALEELSKGPNYYKDRDPKKYAKMLGKLKRDRKTKGHKEEATQKVLQARRREKGAPGTKSGQNGRSGHANGHDKSSTASAVKKLQNAQKKSGQRLSLDRKNNSRGYESKNVRMVPDKLNRGDEENKAKKAYLKNKSKKKK